MHWIDWLIVGIFCAISIGIGLMVRRKATASLEAYFLSNRALGWWLAGTSIVATAFSSDTPLLVTGMVRRRGIWGVWEVWALGISTMLTVFVFSKLWKRANVTTEVELVEQRYSGKPAAFLRGFKALYWGLFYNCYVMGVWPVVGMTKVFQEITGLSRHDAVVGSVVIGAIYTSFSGLWGVVLTDAFQFVWAMVGAVLLAVYSVHAVGGITALVSRLHGTGALAIIPPGPAPGTPFLESPLGWLVGLLLIQWWAWKNADGGGVVVQRLVSCKDERQAMLSVLWFNFAHYCLRSWPWIITALASIILVPDGSLTSTVNGHLFIDHERSYPRLITMLLPTGLRGVMVAAFFAAFLSTISSQLNWGASYLLNDFYKRFIRRDASQRHYLLVARLLPFLLALGAMGVAFCNQSIGDSFTTILNLTAGIGPVYLLRWFWWRINPWSEIAAMIASLPILELRPAALHYLGLPAGSLTGLLFMVVGTASIWLPVTLLTEPVNRGTLKAFYAKVRPPGFWRQVSLGVTDPQEWRKSLIDWVVGTIALLAATVGPLEFLLGSKVWGFFWCALALAGWLFVLRKTKQGAAPAS